MSKKYDILIIGAGPAGLTAAIYASRAGMDTAVLEKTSPGGQLWLSDKIDNYPGYAEGINSFALADQMEKQAKRFGAEIQQGEVKALKKESDGMCVTKDNGENVYSYAVIISSGASMRRLGAAGEEELVGKGVSYCAVCDGPLYKDKEVIVVGGGNTACEEALYLTRFVKKVVLVHRRSELRAVKYLAEEVRSNGKIELRLESQIVKINGTQKVDSVEFDSGDVLDTAGVFIFIGLEPSTGFTAPSMEIAEKGFIQTDMNMHSSVDGVFAAGDCRNGAFRQVVTACADGALAAEEARKYVENLKGTAYGW